MNAPLPARHGRLRPLLSLPLLFALCTSVGAQQVLPIAQKQRVQTPPDNVLILVADDMGVDMCGIYGEGSNVPATPVIDALATGGVLFRNAWSHPNCSATRAALQTGRYGYRNGIGMIIDGASPVGLPLAETTLPEMLNQGSKSTWASAAIGKWHLGHPSEGGDLSPNLSGYGHFAGTMGNLLPPQQDHYTWRKVVDGVAGTVNVYSTTAQVDDALAWLQNAPEPWICYVAFSAPHFPFQAPPPALHTVDLANAGTSSFPFYSAMVEAMDTEIGRLLDGIAPPVLARTNVMFVGDNGTPTAVLQPPLTAGKFSVFEGGVNVPLIVNGPAVRSPGRESPALVHVVDLFATVASIAGVDLAQALPGVALDSVSFHPVLRDDPAGQLRTTVFTEMFSPNGVGNLPPLPALCPDPSVVVCQTDLGFATPGGATLTVCGGELYGGNSADLLLTGNIPNAPGALYVGQAFNPTPVLGGTLVPFPFSSYFPLITDAQGNYASKVIGNTPSLFYYQSVVFDPLVIGAAEFSNALAVEGLATDIRAARDVRYKLIDNRYLCKESFYDLLADPLEKVNLLSGTLSRSQSTSYQTLRAAIDATVQP